MNADGSFSVSPKKPNIHIHMFIHTPPHLARRPQRKTHITHDGSNIALSFVFCMVRAFKWREEKIKLLRFFSEWVTGGHDVCVCIRAVCVWVCVSSKGHSHGHRVVAAVYIYNARGLRSYAFHAKSLSFWTAVLYVYSIWTTKEK